MRTKYWRYYTNYEREEQWLNAMAAKGLALRSYLFCWYEFEPCVPGEYIYRIELLENHANTAESIEYIRFMEESGVEFVTSHIRWVYFRKKAADGPFDIYSDIPSRISHFRRIAALSGTLMAAEFLIGTFNVAFSLENTDRLDGLISSINLPLGILCLLLGVVCFWMGWPAWRSLHRLKKEQRIRE